MTMAISEWATPAFAGVDLAKDLTDLQQLDLQGLRIRWRKIMRQEAPAHLGKSLLLRVIAYKLQARVHGDLDIESVRYLEAIEKERVRRRRAGEQKAKQVPPVPAVAVERSFKPGTLFVREFGNQMHAVTVVTDGFAWNGDTYRSLSEIARLITGTQWSGPRFFGIKQKARTSLKAEVAA